MMKELKCFYKMYVKLISPNLNSHFAYL